jgi:SAM-dependent methyltransferase
MRVSQDSQENKTERDVIEYIGQDEEPYDRPIQRYDHARRRQLIDGLLDGAARERVLDLGCSNGSWFGFFKDQGFKAIHGVELSEHRAALATEKGYQVYNGPGQDTPFDDGYFDVIVNQDVIVHVLQDADRRGMVREAGRILKPGDTYILSIVSMKAERRRRRINLITGYSALSWLKHKLVGHQGRSDRLQEEDFVRHWDVDDLKQFLAEIGLEVQETVGHHFYFGDWSSNVVFLQRAIDSLLCRRWPSAASVVFVKCTK